MVRMEAKKQTMTPPWTRIGLGSKRRTLRTCILRLDIHDAFS